MDDISRVGHALCDGFLVRPLSRGMRTQPGRGRAMTVFAGNSIGNLKRSAALLRSSRKRMADQALLRLLRFGAKLQNARHALADFAGKGLIRATVLVLQNPCGIFVLEDATVRDRFYTAMTTGSRAGTRPDVFNGLWRVRCAKSGGQEAKQRCGQQKGGPRETNAIFRRHGVRC